MSEIFRYSFEQNKLALIPSRKVESNKGTYGRLVCVCGSRGMAGAAYLAAKAALRTGAGLVEIVTPEENLIPLQTLIPEAIVTAYNSEEPSVADIERAVLRADAIVCGCGLGVSRQSLTVLSKVLRTAKVPMVLDADALNLLARNPSLMKYVAGNIITPHAAEMSRLMRVDINDVLADPTGACVGFATKHSLICALKGHNTLVSDGGNRLYVNKTGNSALATAGSGDVLAGIIGGILAQNKDGEIDAVTVASLGVYIHGLCGEIAAKNMSQYSVIASDVIATLPKVMLLVEREKEKLTK